MNYQLITDVIKLVENFEARNPDDFSQDIRGFKQWIAAGETEGSINEPDWESKSSGRSPESVISTQIVKMNRYARHYVRSILQQSDFSTQDEFVYLINLKVFGEMTKMELIKKNIQDKPAGMQIIGRLLSNGWVSQTGSGSDKRSKLLSITPKGLEVLEGQMHKIRQATKIVTGNITHQEKMQLIRILSKLDNFHQHIYNQNIESAHLLDYVSGTYMTE